MSPAKTFEMVFHELKTNGFLMLLDSSLPSIVGIIAGETFKGSWWGHPKGNEIFNCSSDIDDHKDVLSAKLINDKVTFIHQSLWPAFFGIVAERQTWQTKLLSPAAKKILKKSDKSALQTKDISDMEPKERSAVIAELEKKLLVHSRQIHTESGKHERVLQSWESLIAERFSRKKLLSPGAGIEAIEESVAKTARKTTGKIKYPWLLAS